MFMFEGIDFSKMGQMLEEAQKKAQEIEQESQKREFSVKSGGGLISVRANGKGEVLDISIDDSLLEDKESLQILLISAVNDVLKPSLKDEQIRLNLDDLQTANIKRAQESARVLEECFKLVDVKISEIFKAVRYELYEIEKEI